MVELVERQTAELIRGLWFKSPGSILNSRTETSSLSRVVGDGWDPSSVPLIGGEVSCGGIFDLAIEQPQPFRKLPKNKTFALLIRRLLHTLILTDICII